MVPKVVHPGRIPVEPCPPLEDQHRRPGLRQHVRRYSSARAAADDDHVVARPHRRCLDCRWPHRQRDRIRSTHRERPIPDLVPTARRWVRQVLDELKSVHDLAPGLATGTCSGSIHIPAHRSSPRPDARGNGFVSYSTSQPLDSDVADGHSNSSGSVSPTVSPPRGPWSRTPGPSCTRRGWGTRSGGPCRSRAARRRPPDRPHRGSNRPR